MSGIRLDKYISDSGEFSRKEVKELLKRGRVSVNGVLESSGELKIDPENDKVALDGREIAYKTNIYIMMNKPAGVISATEDLNEKTVLDIMDKKYKKLGLFPVGRLDKDAEGLLLLTDDGNFAHKLMSPKSHIEKRYYVETEGALTGSDADEFEKGIVLKDGLKCLPGHLEILESGEVSCGIAAICEGKYHQVKRMLASLGKPVKYLKRVSIGGLSLDADLTLGDYRELTDVEFIQIFQKKD